MSPFEFVSVFFAVVLGLAVTHLMGSIGELIEVRSRVRGYWVLNLWVLNVLLLQTQSWWGTWGLREREWNVLAYFLVVVYFAAVYLATVLLLPPVREGDEVIDLRLHYYQARRAFFAALALAAVLAALMNVALFGSAALSVVTLIPLGFVLLAATGAWTASPVYHAAYAILFGALYALFMIADGVRIG